VGESSGYDEFGLLADNAAEVVTELADDRGAD
jgi:hypothetical protein